jgi:hypothetical protein
VGPQYKAADATDFLLSLDRIAVVDAATIATEPGPTAREVKLSLSTVRDDSRRWTRFEDRLEKARKLANPAFWTHDLVVVVDERVDPESAGEGKYRSGRILGRAYLWSYGERAIVCAADVAAESSESVHLREGLQSTSYLKGDLHGNAVAAAKKALFRVGPRGAPAPPDPSMPSGTWKGTCGLPGRGWSPVEAKLSFEPRGPKLLVSGTMTFIKRTTEAWLEGERKGDRYELRGFMKEKAEPRSEWKLALTVDARKKGEPLRGSLEEINILGEINHMCSFAWPESKRTDP